MADNYLIVVAQDYETLDTVILNVVSTTGFMRTWGLLGQTLGFQMAPGSQKLDLHVTKSGNDYIIHHLTKPSSSNAKITVSNFKFEFIPGTINLGEATSTQLAPATTAKVLLINNDDEPKKFKRKFTTTSSNSTTVSSSHKIAAEFSIKQSYSAGVPGVFSASLGFNFSFSYQYTFGNQQKNQETIEFSDTVSIVIPAKTTVPLLFTNYKSKLSVPFTALAQMSYNISFDGPFNRSGAPHKDLGTPTSDTPQIIKYSYQFGDGSTSAEDAVMTEAKNSFIPGSSEWNWPEIIATSHRLDLDFMESIKNGFATQINGKFEKDDSKVVIIQTGTPPNIPLNS